MENMEKCFIDNEDRKPEDFILPDGIESEEIGISKYIRYIIDKHKIIVPGNDLEVLEYVVAHSDF